MRKGRFAGLSDSGPDAAGPPSWADLLLFDFRAADGAADDRIARDRLRLLRHSAPFLLFAHLACGGALLFGLLQAGLAPDPFRFYLPLALAILADLALWLVSSPRLRLAPHVSMRLRAACFAAGASIWVLIVRETAAAWSGAGGAGETALAAGMAAGLAPMAAAFMPVPLLAAIGCLAALAAAFLFPAGLPLVLVVAAFSASLFGLSLARARDAIAALKRRLLADRDGERARRFVADVESGGGGWFWETNADGAIAYLSESLARELGRDPAELAGRSFAELLLVEDRGPAEGAKASLGFHLSARFPFSDVIVTPNGRDDICWSVSGRPSFDELGRFLGFRGMGVSLSEQRRADARSSRLARFDSLTGLPNRASMRAMLEEALRNADSRKEGCSLLVIDLDRFKQVNDTLGHPVGDLLLKEVAQRLSATVGQDGEVGRLGGDEFEAVLPGIDEEGHLAALAERMIRKVTEPYLVRGHAISIGASVGIAISRPGRTYCEALIKEADLALYAAKGAGRGTFRFFEPEMHAESTERQILETDLRGAVAKGQLRLAFQPIVDSGSEDLVGFEALVRWAHPVRGILAPADFLPLAEARGLMPAIGEWVLRAACAEAAKWPGHLRLAVNLSPLQLAEPGLPAIVTGALAAAGIEPARLEFDLTEDALLADDRAAAERLARLKGLGVRLSLDDFGHGAASIASLAVASLDAVKIHPSLIRAALQGSRTESLLRATVALAESLSVSVVAEGVETLEELAAVRRIGCAEVQGFLFGRPMPAEEALALASESKPLAAREAVPGRAPRHSLIRLGALAAAGKAHDVRLRNISPGGAMVETGQKLDPGSEVELRLADDVRIAAEVRWAQEGRLGLRFAEAFALERLGKAKRDGTAPLLRPDYLRTETQPDSPWAARRDRLTIKDVRRQ